MLGAPGEQALGEFEPHRQERRVVGEIAQFARIVFEVVEQRRQPAAEMHVFELLRPDDRQIALLRLQAEMPLGRALLDRAEIELPMRRVAPGRRRLAVKERSERPAVEMRRRRLAEQVDQRRHDVDRLGEALDPRARSLPAARIADDQRDVKALVEEAAFAEQEMVAHHLGMVGGEDDDRVVPGAGCLDRRPDAAELRVDLRDHAVVERADRAELALAEFAHLALHAGQELRLLLPADRIVEIGVRGGFLAPVSAVARKPGRRPDRTACCRVPAR